MSRPTATEIAGLLDEHGQPLFPPGPHPDYIRLRSAGEPMVHVKVAGFIDRPCVLLQANLDGSKWVMGWNGSPFLIEGRNCTPYVQRGARTTDPETSHQAWEQVNEHGLSNGQLKVLLALRDAGERGLIDHEHEPLNGLEQDSAGKRRGELVKKGLVRARTEYPSKRTSPRGTPAQVWVITDAGQQALRSRVPSVPRLSLVRPAM